MSADPFKPPDSDISIDEVLPPRPVLGITAGFLVDTGGTIAGSFIVMLVYGIVLGATGGTAADIERFVANYDPYSLIGFILVFVGLAMSYLAGYVCARVSRARDLKYPAVLATISFVTGTLAGWDEEHIVMLLLLGVVGFVAILIGARRQILKRRLK